MLLLHVVYCRLLSDYVEIVKKIVSEKNNAEHFTLISLQFHKNQPRGMYCLHKRKFTKHKTKTRNQRIFKHNLFLNMVREQSCKNALSFIFYGNGHLAPNIWSIL